MRMSNAARNEAVALKAQARREREEREATRAKELAEREAKIQKALTAKPETLVDRHFRFSPTVAEKYSPFREILEVIEKKAPRMAERTTLNALNTISKLPFLRSPRDWKPKGKGRDTLFRGLCEHLLAKYPMPQFLWSAFYETDSVDTFAKFVGFVAGGGSVFEAVKQGLVHVPFTRKMCHEFMTTPSHVTFLRALRRTPVFAFGGSERFLDVWMTSQAGRVLHAKETEAFWFSVLEWFGKNTMVDPSQVGPLTDYLLFRRRQDPAFSMKGRSILATIRGMEEWHAQLTKEKAIHGMTFKPSGYRDYETQKGVRDSSGNFITETWRVKEILSSKALAEEGRKLNHCVYSYSWSVEKGSTSIWSMTFESSLDGGASRCVTIELKNETRRIVQVRGRFNRAATSREFQVLKEWAGMNNLEIGTYL